MQLLNGAVALCVALFATHALADGPAPRAAMPPISDEARQHFQAGVSLLQDPEGERVEEAYREFKTAHDISGSPKILGNMGFCAMRLERDGEAIDAYSTYLREVPDIDPDERAQIARDTQTLSVGVVRVTIEIDKPNATLLDTRVPVRGERVTNAYGPVTGKIDIGIRPGHHIVHARLDGYEDAMWEFDAHAGAREKFSFVMKPRVVAAVGGTQPAAHGPSAAPWIVTGAGVAMLAAGAITGIVALGKTNDIEKQCPSDKCPKGFDLDGERSSAKTFVRLTDVLLIGGGVVTAGGLTWLFLSSRSSEAPPQNAAALVPNLACGPNGCTGTVGGRF